MRPGDLACQIVIQQAGTARDSFGQTVETWGTFATVWAEILPLRGTELFTAQQFQSKITAKVRIHFLRGVSPKMRVLFGSRIFEIHNIINTTERNRELVLMCSEVQ